MPPPAGADDAPSVSQTVSFLVLSAVAFVLAIAALSRASLFARTRARRVVARVTLALLVVTVGGSVALLWWWFSHWQFEF
jgi:hypothetical protein